MEVATHLYNFDSLAKLIELLRQILFNLAITAITGVILIPISAEQVNIGVFLAQGCFKVLETGYLL